MDDESLLECNDCVYDDTEYFNLYTSYNNKGEIDIIEYQCTDNDESLEYYYGYEWKSDIPQIINTHTDNNLDEYFELEKRLDYVF